MGYQPVPNYPFATEQGLSVQGPPSPRAWYGITILTRDIEPQVDRFLSMRDSRRGSPSMGHATRKLGNLRYKNAIVRIPGHNDSVQMWFQGASKFPRSSG